MGLSQRRLAAGIVCVLPWFATQAALAAEPPPPTDAELTRYVALQDALAGDAARRGAICAMMEEGSSDDRGSDDVAAAARRAEAHPILGPLLRQKGLTGRRYVELSVQVASVLIGAAIADDADATARAAGRPATNRQTLLASSPSAPPVLQRQGDLTRALGAVQAVCEPSDDDGYEEEEEEPEAVGAA